MNPEWRRGRPAARTRLDAPAGRPGLARGRCHLLSSGPSRLLHYGGVLPHGRCRRARRSDLERIARPPRAASDVRAAALLFAWRHAPPFMGRIILDAPCFDSSCSGPLQGRARLRECTTAAGRPGATTPPGRAVAAALAVRGDSRVVATVALTTFAAWRGVAASPLERTFWTGDAAVRSNAMATGLLFVVLGRVLIGTSRKAHFEPVATYLGWLLILGSTLSGSTGTEATSFRAGLFVVGRPAVLAYRAARFTSSAGHGRRNRVDCPGRLRFRDGCSRSSVRGHRIAVLSGCSWHPRCSDGREERRSGGRPRRQVREDGRAGSRGRSDERRGPRSGGYPTTAQAWGRSSGSGSSLTWWPRGTWAVPLSLHHRRPRVRVMLVSSRRTGGRDRVQVGRLRRAWRHRSRDRDSDVGYCGGPGLGAFQARPRMAALGRRDPSWCCCLWREAYRWGYTSPVAAAAAVFLRTREARSAEALMPGRAARTAAPAAGESRALSRNRRCRRAIAEVRESLGGSPFRVVGPALGRCRGGAGRVAASRA